MDYIAGKWRVNGRLAVTRCFGDENLKPVVTSEPEVAHYPLTADDEMMMLSCDGIFDVMNNNEVAQFLDGLLKKEKGRSPAKWANALVDEAVNRGGTDDITGTFKRWAGANR